MSRSRKVRLGFVVVNTRTDEHLTKVYTRRAHAREALTSFAVKGLPVGVRTLEEHVSADWIPGRDYEIVEGKIVRKNFTHEG